MPHLRIVVVLCALIAASCDHAIIPSSPDPATPPTITRITPNSGVTGTKISVMIDGTGFSSGIKVMFGGASLSGVVVTSTRIIGTVSGFDPGTVDVVVLSPNGTGAHLLSGFTFERSTDLTPPVVTRLSVTQGITGGGEWLDLFGTFQSGAKVTIGGQPAVMMAVTPTRIFVVIPANPAGAADVVVTNPNGQSTTLPGAFTYMAPYNGDFNGMWEGYGGVDDNVPIQFTIEHDRLIGVKCGSAPLRTLNVPAPVVGGGFSVSESGFEMTGSLINDDVAGGLIKFPACADIPLGWQVYR
jgi:hypothetical protein